ncbi:peptide-aspartate beta-dioxygenase [Chrysochromulina tobinii]|jgi:aspartate beta-hydroxylase|uniref:Peptide-aspartate beta-dioxygenase n=1 Tax=Chrysochromulina tobinii TaxID=1460289 RepID=A0A0M0JCK8_9EUKA|nr:peptide-aspartate beta-dioxygenase [Chrysochromulina tobinii]|eukprot:KOO24087.1 peptide-aspartate beta-dioxygenase [Chrysochromulina sp. CCMP291]
MLSHPPKSWWGNSAELEAKIPRLLQSGAAAEARALLQELAEEDAPITLFYLGVATGQLEGEAAACGHYERALKQLPLLHAARNNLIRGLMRRGKPADLKQALEHAKLAAGLQPDLAEMQYQLGVVQMQQAVYSEAAAAFEAALRLEATHRGALINGIHCLQLLPPADRKGRERLEKMAHLGVAAGLWRHPMQRPPHLVPQLASKPWHDRADFPWCSLLESQFAAIRAEVEALRSSQQQLFMSVGGRAAHDHTLVAAGKWTEFPLFGNGTKYTENCARCPVTAAIMERIAPAMELAFAGGGETLFSTLNPGTHLRPHCGSSNTRLTAHLGILVPSGCSIRAGNEWREWREGECLVFDDSWEHEVRHLGDRDRVVLLINFWHPDLLPHERRIDTNTFGYEPI